MYVNVNRNECVCVWVYRLDSCWLYGLTTINETTKHHTCPAVETQVESRPDVQESQAQVL